MTEILTGADVDRTSFKETVVTIGVFDGVHLGHLKVIHALAAAKRKTGAVRSVLVTFDRHPLCVTHLEMVPPLLTTLDEKLSILRSLDIDTICVETFTGETARTDYHDYIARRLVGGLGMIHLVIGYDFHLGRGREGSQNRLVNEGRARGFGVTVVPPVVVGGSVISSTKIRRAVLERKLQQAARCLTRHFFFDADVVRGAGFGGGIDFPTANISVPAREKLLPADGVYVVKVELGGAVYGGMMNVGGAPTLHVGDETRIEVHIFDFSGDLYGRRLRVHCLKFLRLERKFEGPSELRAQLVEDREHALAVLEKKD